MTPKPGRSYRRVNYALRPAKYIERKMIVEGLRAVSRVFPLDTYRYVGLGSIYFTDFILFHRELGIETMVSIEEDVDRQKRFEFNQPLNSITIKFGESNEVLPSLDWTQQTIAWLDYDDPLSAEVLADVSTFVSSAKAGSVLIVTVNAAPGELDGRKDRFETLFGKGILALDATDSTLGDWGTAEYFRRILIDRIESAVADRNGPLPDAAKVEFHQMFHFHYRDGQRMMTLGGIFVDAGLRPSVLACDFDSIPACRTGEDACVIKVPNLTTREMRHLDTQLPADDLTAVGSAGVTAAEVEAYAQIYRFVPAFIQID